MSAPADRSSPAATESSLAPAVTRAAAVLDVLAASGGEPLGPSELSRRLGIPKSSIANVGAALTEAGLLRRVGSNFALGAKLVELAGAYLATVDIVEEFYNACNQLETASDETIQLGILDGTEVTYIGRHDGRQPIRLASDIGRRLPASCTAMGKAALASVGPEGVAARYRGIRWLPTLTARSHRTLDALIADLERVRSLGYATDDEETTDGVACFAVALPTRGSAAGPYAASVTLLKARATDAYRDSLVADLHRLSRLLSHRRMPRAASC